MALTDNLESYYKLDDDASNTHIDDALGNNDGTLIGGDDTADLSESGKIVDCLHLDGSNDYINLNWDYDPTAFSFAGWVWFDDLDGVQFLISDRAVGDWTHQIRMRDNGEIEGWVKTSGGEYEVTTDNGSGNVSAGEWIYVALTYDGETLKLYVNGSLEDTNTNPSGKNNNNNDLTLGAQSDGDNKLDGKLDEWGIWSKNLTSDEITQLWNGGNGFPYPFTGITPTIQATNLNFTNVLNTKISVDWDNGDGAKRALFIKEGSTGSATPVDNITYTANTTFKNGTQIGTTGWYCGFNGVGSEVTITGLTKGTTYNFMVTEYNE